MSIDRATAHDVITHRNKYKIHFCVLSKQDLCYKHVPYSSHSYSSSRISVQTDASSLDLYYRYASS